MTGFLESFIKKYGYPQWDKAVVSYGRQHAESFATNNFDEETDTLVKVPFLQPDSNMVKTFTVASVNNSTRVFLYRANDYDRYRYGDVNGTTLTADRIIIQLLIFNEDIFGHRKYVTTDTSLFDVRGRDSYESAYMTLELNDPAILDQASFGSGTTITTCGVVPATNFAGNTQLGTTNNYASGPRCVTLITFHDNDEGWVPPPPPIGGGGGGSNGGTETSSTDCTGSIWCDTNGEISNGIEPCGDCGLPPVWPAYDEETDANGFYLSRIAELDAILQANPFALDPCDSLILINLQTYGGMYQQVATFHPGQYVKDRLDSLRNANTWWSVDNYNIQSLENAYGPVVNCDFFPIQITQFPTNQATQAPMTPQEFLEYFRLNINSFITPSVGVHFDCNLSTQVPDCYKWNLPDGEAIGALSHIDINGPVGTSDDGTIVLSDYQHINNINAQQHYFKFSTIQSPYDGYHPVAGNREFGIYNTNANLGQFTFYIMGVDRTSNIISDIVNANNYGFLQGDSLWLNVTENMDLFINNNGGQSSFYSQKKHIARPYWNDVKRYLKKQISFAELNTLLGC